MPGDVLFDSRFQVRASPTGAQGVFAIAPLADKTMVKVDCFVLIIRDPPGGTTVSDKVKSDFYVEQWEGVMARFGSRTPRVQDAIRHLEPKQKPGEPSATWLNNVLKVNGWNHSIHQSLGRKEDATMLSIFKGSKFNHSCAPTLQPRLIVEKRNLAVKKLDTNAEKQGQEFWMMALADIATGDEVTVSYLTAGELKRNVYMRRAQLKNTWGFDCTCSKCVQELMKAQRTSCVSERSTASRQAIAELRIQTTKKRRAQDAENRRQRIHNRFHKISMNAVAMSGDVQGAVAMSGDVQGAVAMSDDTQEAELESLHYGEDEIADIQQMFDVDGVDAQHGKKCRPWSSLDDYDAESLDCTTRIPEPEQYSGTANCVSAGQWNADIHVFLGLCMTQLALQTRSSDAIQVMTMLCAIVDKNIILGGVTISEDGRNYARTHLRGYASAFYNLLLKKDEELRMQFKLTWKMKQTPDTDILREIQAMFQDPQILEAIEGMSVISFAVATGTALAAASPASRRHHSDMLRSWRKKLAENLIIQQQNAILKAQMRNDPTKQMVLRTCISSSPAATSVVQLLMCSALNLEQKLDA